MGNISRPVRNGSLPRVDPRVHRSLSFSFEPTFFLKVQIALIVKECN